MLGNEPVRFGGRPHGKGPAQQAPRRAAHPAVKVRGVWRYVYRAVDQHGQVIDVLLSPAVTPQRPAGSSPERCGP
jgi:transposase-like protein